MTPASRLSAVHVVPGSAGGWTVGVIGKRTYLVVNGRCVEVPQQLALVEAPRPTADGVCLEQDIDLLLGRAQADIVVTGHAYPPDRASAFVAGLLVGDLRRVFHVFGDRRCELGPTGHPRFTPPEPVTRIPLRWESAYGGYDATALQQHGDVAEALLKQARIAVDPRFGLFAYPRNPRGKGYLTELTRAGLEACLLPNLEDPDDLLTPETLIRGPLGRWPLGPKVAATGWLSYNFFPRSACAGIPPMVYDSKAIRPEDFFEVREGGLRRESVLTDVPIDQRLDDRFIQCAAMGMRVADVSAIARVELIHLHPTERRWRFDLPGELPRMYLRLPGQEPTKLQPRIRTVILEPDDSRVCLVWTGEITLPATMTEAQMKNIEHAILWRH